MSSMTGYSHIDLHTDYGLCWTLRVRVGGRRWAYWQVVGV